jgi:hypothetical protein
MMPDILMATVIRNSIETAVAEVFENYLKLMNYADYFFREPWSEKRIPPFGFSDEEWKFIESSEGYAEEVERFTVV